MTPVNLHKFILAVYLSQNLLTMSGLKVLGNKCQTIP